MPALTSHALRPVATRRLLARQPPLAYPRQFVRTHASEAAAAKPRPPTAREPAKRPAPSAAAEAAAEEAAAGKGSPPEPSVPNPNSIAPVSFWQRLGPVSRAFNAYSRAQRRRPLLTQLLGTMVVYACGDFSAQRIGGDDYNPKRTARALVIGAIASIPSYKWFLFLGNNFNYASRALSLGTKIVVNQVVFTPIFSCYFFGMQSVLSGGTVADTWQRIKTTVPTSYVNALKLWPAVTLVNFAYVAPQFRALFAGTVAVGWQTYLSWLNRSAELAHGQLSAGLEAKAAA